MNTFPIENINLILIAASIVTTSNDPFQDGGELDEYEDDYSNIHLLHENEEVDEKDDTLPIPLLRTNPGDAVRSGRSIERSDYQRAMNKIISKSGAEKCENPEQFAASHTLSQTRIHNTTDIASLSSSVARAEKVVVGDEVAETETTTTGSPMPSPTLIFDTPFTWILRDGELGEAVSGSVSSLCQYNKVINAIKSSPAHAWLHDVFKLAFWKCA
jgi:hypothetical protein